MPNAQFAVALETDTESAPRAAGVDSVRFDFSANPGQPPRTLAKVASGGELSRVSLAIQVAALAKRGAPTMIFDEVDAGIRSEEHTSELQSLMRISYAVFYLKKKNINTQ